MESIVLPHPIFCMVFGSSWGFSTFRDYDGLRARIRLVRTSKYLVDVFEVFTSAHRMVMENRPVDPGSIQGSHRPVSFIRIKHRTRANDILCKTEY